MIENVKILSHGNIFLSAYHSTPDGDENIGLNETLVIMVHGFPGSQNANLDLFPSIERVLRPKGFHCLSFDFRGCGESDGELEDFTIKHANSDFQSVLNWAEDHEYKRFILIGEGLGASLSLLNIPEETSCMVLLWPMLDLKLMSKNVFHADELSEEWVKAGYMLFDNQRINITFLQELSNQSLIPQIQKIRTPMLVMYGSNDENTPMECMDILRTHSVSKRVEITGFQNGKQGLPDEKHRKMMHYHMSQFVQKYA